ncbi:unnamed protein product [Brassica rapa]|uniref:Uncharacterized protein n=1 Tax=Brassica campestris TaxID=3711 RepID=A0A8D9DLD9_BRACM|nr:unnamed protein product [Brassica rapa]
MNFTIQRFLNPSIYEYPTLEEDSSSIKERPEGKPIIGVKRSLSPFQKSQDQEKWSRNYEVIIQSPKPVKPVLHLPQLEANRFNQLQTRHWRSGDHFNQSGGIPEPEEFYNFIPCTSSHRNKKIPIITKLPYLESLAFKLQQLFFYHGKDEISIYQAFKKVSRKLSYPLKPSRFKQIKFLHLEPTSHKKLQQLVFQFIALSLICFLSYLFRTLQSLFLIII